VYTDLWRPSSDYFDVLQWVSARKMAGKVGNNHHAVKIGFFNRFTEK
jgi:hypothetical protein